MLKSDRKIRVFGKYFLDFMENISVEAQEKIQYGLLLLKTQERLSTKFVKKIKDGIYELRIEYNSNIYRVFFIFDGNNIVVLFNGFQKKSQKTPKNEIDKAIELKKQYYEYKQQHI